MISLLITLLVYLIVLGLLWWAVNAVMGLLGLPHPVPQIIKVVFILLAVLVIIGMLVGGVGLPRLSL